MTRKLGLLAALVILGSVPALASAEGDSAVELLSAGIELRF